MSDNLLKGKNGIIFGALDENSIAWKTAVKINQQGGKFVLTNAPVALRMGSINNLAEEMIEIDARGGGMKDMDQMLEADGLFDIEIPKNPQRGLTDEEMLQLDKQVKEDKNLEQLEGLGATKLAERFRLKKKYPGIDDELLTNIIEDLIKKSKVVTKKKKVKEKIKADNKSLPDPSLDKLHFKKLKKKLKLPIKGKIIHKFGKKRPDTGIKWKGIFIKANEGDPVYAVAKGKVVFSDWLRGFGNIIIIDHGGDYMSLYGNNESLLKKQNDMIRGGDQIATVGNSGGNNSNGLYYELRKNSKPFNPLAWTNLK